MRGIFVVGTDTGVGKTRVACGLICALLAEGRQVGAIKPVATGAENSESGLRSEDALALSDAVGVDVPINRICPIVFEEPLAPPVAARRAGVTLDFGHLLDAVNEARAWWAERADVLVVEGVGGLLCPIAEGKTVADLAIELDYPLLIVARRALGTLNHTLMTVEAAQRRGLRIAGVVLNGAEPTTDPVVEASNGEELARHLLSVAILPEIAHGQHVSEWAIAARLGAWYSRCDSPRIRDSSSG